MVVVEVVAGRVRPPNGGALRAIPKDPKKIIILLFLFLFIFKTLNNKILILLK
jgi:hypothetical protein